MRDPASSVRPWAFFIAGTAAILLLLGAPALDGLRQIEGWWTGERWDVCAFRVKYGVDCLGCGGTRAFAFAASGHVRTAFAANRLGAMLGLTTWGMLLAGLAAAATRRARYLAAGAVVALIVLSVTLVVHTVLWWRALPPGVHLR